MGVDASYYDSCDQLGLSCLTRFDQPTAWHDQGFFSKHGLPRLVKGKSTDEKDKHLHTFGVVFRLGLGTRVFVP